MSRIPIIGVALVLAPLGAIACRDSAPPTSASPDGPVGNAPSLTLGSGVTPTIIARGNLGAFHVQSKFQGYDLELKTHDETDVQVRSAIAAPGSYSGWHTHPGPVILVIKTGALTIYDASDPDCRATVLCGSAFRLPI